MKFMTTLFACLIIGFAGCGDTNRTSVQVVPTPCSHHNDCPDDMFCAMQDDFEGICAYGCVVDANCAQGEICEGNYCVLGQREEEDPAFNIDVNIELPEPQPMEERCDGQDNYLDGLTDEDCESFCGDGLCEVEEKETFSTCPEDCSVACEAIYDCVPSAFDPGFSECPNCGACLEIACVSGMCALLPADQDGDGHSPDFCSREFDADCDDLDPSIHPGAQETCDGKDNNCDGQTDEDDPAIGSACTTMMHINGNDVPVRGSRVCGEGGLVCAPPVLEDCQLQEEVCDNGLDDNCDGQVNESCPEPEEACDGVDNDNDHAIDEGCPCEDPNPDYWIDRDCGYAMPAGIWSFGYQSCDNGYWTECFGVLAPGEQICNSTHWMWVTDHDADGLVGCDDPDCQDSLLCQKFCVDDSECDAGYACVDNMCVPSVPALCETDDDCVGQLWGPYCVYSQVDDISYCQACLQDIPGEQQYSVDGISPGCDSELPVCAWDVQGVPISEQHPSGQVSFYWCTECGSQMPCPDGQSCVVGECVPDESCQPDLIFQFAPDSPGGTFVPGLQMLVAKVVLTAPYEDAARANLLVHVQVQSSTANVMTETWVLRDENDNILSMVEEDIAGDEFGTVSFEFVDPFVVPAGQTVQLSIYVDTIELGNPGDSLQLWLSNSCQEQVYSPLLVKP